MKTAAAEGCVRLFKIDSKSFAWAHSSFIGEAVTSRTVIVLLGSSWQWRNIRKCPQMEPHDVRLCIGDYLISRKTDTDVEWATVETNMHTDHLREETLSWNPHEHKVVGQYFTLLSRFDIHILVLESAKNTCT